MGEALKVLVGPQAQGLSASTVSRLKQVWAQEYRSWCDERLDKERWVYVWADGVYSRNGPTNLDSAVSEIFLGFQAANSGAAWPKYTASGVRRSSALCRRLAL